MYNLQFDKYRTGNHVYQNNQSKENFYKWMGKISISLGSIQYAVVQGDFISTNYLC